MAAVRLLLGITLLLFIQIWFNYDVVQAVPADDVKYLKQHIDTLTKQVMLQQFFSEQRVRSEGQSGVKINRLRRSGSKNYFTETHTGYSACSIHDHASYIRTVGLGELVAVLNGIEFQTRHNDYRLTMPHSTSKAYHATEDIPFPDVPPEVTAKPTVSEQIIEMKAWFEAFQNQDHSKRDYRKYFKPVLCYLEGGWTSTASKIDEPFKSERHFVDAATWMELHEKARFMAYSGSKSLLENLSFLPTKIIGFKDGVPVFAQWNYRILCHPIRKKISFKDLEIVDDMSSRMMTRYNIYRHTMSRGARFQLKSKNLNRPFYGVDNLDDIMEEIPGKDNYQGRLFDEGVDAKVLNDDMTEKDVSKYHRWYKVGGKDAMGTSNIHRGYSDNFLFTARTTQPKVVGMSIKKCQDNRKQVNCRNLTQKWTYAIPLEIIFLTPLSKWNPYNLKYHGKYKPGSKATFGGRNGQCSNGKQLDGTDSKHYYRTPDEFYSGSKQKTQADASVTYACVLDQQGVSRKVRAAGTYQMLPYIKDVGLIRQRYPIFPVHGEGSSVWKEVNAIREVVMDMKKHWQMLWDPELLDKDLNRTTTLFYLGLSQASFTSPHNHFFEMTLSELTRCKGGQEVFKTTSVANGHQHELRIRWEKWKKVFIYYRCEEKYKCADLHPKELIKEDFKS